MSFARVHQPDLGIGQVKCLSPIPLADKRECTRVPGDISVPPKLPDHTAI